MKDKDKKKEQRPIKKKTLETNYKLMLDEAIEQNEFLRTVLDSIPHTLFVVDVSNFTINLANKTARWGALPENATCYSYIHNKTKPCESTDYVCPLERLKATKQPVIVERTHNDEAGNLKYIEIQAFPIFDTKGNVVQMIECSMNITNRKLLEDELKKSEEKFSMAFHRNPGISAITTMKDGRYVDVNEGFCLLTGYMREELIGHTMDEVGLSSAERRRELRDRIAEHGAIRNILLEMRTKTGEKRLVLHSAESFNIGDEQYVIFLANDVTEGKRTAEALQESEKKYRELADSLPQIIFELEEKGYFTFANRKAFQATGYTQEDLDAGLHALQVFIPEDRKRVQQNIQRVLSGEELKGNEYTAMRKDGSTFPVVIYSTPIVKRNAVVGLRGIVIEAAEHGFTKRKSTG